MPGTSQWMVSMRRGPELGESLNGFISRVAAAEGLPNTLELTSLAGAAWSHRPGLSRGGVDFSGLAACLRLEPHELEAMSYPVDPERPGRRLFRGLSVDRRLIVHDERRFSPTTLGRTGIHPAEWQLRPFPFCRHRWEFLGARCPDVDCGAIQRWYHATGVGLCDRCGEPLSRATHAGVPDGDRRDLANALGLLDPDAARRDESVMHLTPVLRAVARGELLDLLVAVAVVHEPAIRCPSDHLTIRNDADPAILTAAVADAWRTMTRWPEGFHDLASARIAERAGRFGDGNRGATMRLLEMPMDDNASPTLAGLVEDLRRTIQATVDERGIGCRAAGELPHLKPSRLVALRRQGVLSTLFALDADEPQPYLDRFEVRSLSEALRSSLPLNGAACMLGTSEHGVEQLETMGLLDFERLAGTVASDGAPRVTASSVRRLLDSLAERAGESTPEYIPLTSVMRTIGGRPKPWGPVIRMLLDGQVTYAVAAGSTPIVRRVYVDPTQTEKLTTSIYVTPPEARFMTMMSKRDALEVLNVHARHGTTVLNRWPSHKSVSRTVPVDDVLGMARRLVSLGELVARTGRGAQTVIGMLAGSGVSIEGIWSPRGETEAALLGESLEATSISPDRSDLHT